MDKKYLQAELKREGDKIVFIASDETLDRQGEVIPLDSWDLKNYRKNPVLLVNHDYMVQNIVGKAKNLKVDKNKASGKNAMFFEPVFHGITQLSKEVEQMVKEGVLNTVSVGFIRRGPAGDGQKESNELIEISFVPVPANPSAEQLSVLMSKAIKAEEEEQIKEFVAEAEQKEGRVLSQKNRSLVERVRDGMKETVSALEELLAAAEPAKDLDSADSNTGNGSKDTEIHTETKPDVEEQKTQLDILGKGGKGRARGNNLQIKVLQHVAKELNRALYKLKKQS